MGRLHEGRVLPVQRPLARARSARVVKPNGNILVFGTYHNIYQLGFILQNVLERRILNSVVWFKPNAQPNITARTLTESTEQIIWAVNETPAKATGWTFNYWDAKEMNGGKQMRNLWEFPVTAKRERPKASTLRRSRLGCSSARCCSPRNPAICCSTHSAAPGRWPSRRRSTTGDWLLIESVAEYADIAERRIEAAG